MNQKGFATMSLLALIPLLLSIAAFAAGSFLVLRENRRALFECRAGLMDAQEQLLGDMDQLLKLNPQAKLLKTRRAVAQAAVAAAATTPATLAVAETALNVVIGEQEALDTLQKSIITKANVGSRVRMQKVSKKVSDDIMGVQNPNLSVEPVTPELAPEYKVSPEIEQNHTMRINWVFHPLKALPDWLNKILEQTPLKFNAECSTTSEKGDLKWNPRLKRDKPWSNLHSF